MKKREKFFLAMMCMLALVGCGTFNNVEKAENNLSQPAVTSEEIKVMLALGDAQELMQALFFYLAVC